MKLFARLLVAKVKCCRNTLKNRLNYWPLTNARRITTKEDTDGR